MTLLDKDGRRIDLGDLVVDKWGNLATVIGIDNALSNLLLTHTKDNIRYWQSSRECLYSGKPFTRDDLREALEGLIQIATQPDDDRDSV